MILLLVLAWLILSVPISLALCRAMTLQPATAVAPELVPAQDELAAA